MKQGNDFLRGVLAIDQIITKMLRISFKPPSAENLRQRRMLCEHLGFGRTKRCLRKSTRAAGAFADLQKDNNLNALSLGASEINICICISFDFRIDSKWQIVSCVRHVAF